MTRPASLSNARMGTFLLADPRPFSTTCRAVLDSTMPNENLGGIPEPVRSYRGAWLSVGVILAMVATLLVLTYQTNGGNLLGSLPAILDASFSSTEQETSSTCRTTCVKTLNGKLFEFAQFHEPRQYPIPQCRNPRAEGQGMATGAKPSPTDDMCSTWCAKSQRSVANPFVSTSPSSTPSSSAQSSPSSTSLTKKEGSTTTTSRNADGTLEEDDQMELTELTGSYSQIHAISSCPLDIIPARPMPQEGTHHTWTAKAQRWDRWENFAEDCNEFHALDRRIGDVLESKTLHIVYFTWLTNNQNLRKIIPAQMKDVIESGLFDRPNTKVYMIVSSESDEEFKWFMDQDWVQKYKPEVLRTKRNQYEFAGIRFLWELGCKYPEDLFLYFHSKGARYGRGRIGMEVILTREIVVPWKLILNLMAANPGAQSLGLGGPGFQWMNFFWTRGALYLTTPKPNPVNDRYYYENWMGLDLRYGKFREVSEKEVSECSQATGMEEALKERIVPEPKTPRGTRVPQYGLLRCAQTYLGVMQMDAWSSAASARMEQFMTLQTRIRQLPK